MQPAAQPLTAVNASPANPTDRSRSTAPHWPWRGRRPAAAMPRSGELPPTPAWFTGPDCGSRADAAAVARDPGVFWGPDAARRLGALAVWLPAVALALFAALSALRSPIEEHAYDAATFHVPRAVVFSAARADGWLYPRWVDAIEGGLGGPLFSFYPPLAYFALDLFNGLGFAHPLSWRLLAALSFVVASTGASALARALGHPRGTPSGPRGRSGTPRRSPPAAIGGALAAGAAFTYAPYLLQEVFERGSPQELAIALYPWLGAALLWLAAAPSGPRLALAALLWAAVILSHNLAALLVTPVLALLILASALRHGARAAAGQAAALGLGALLAAFYLLPSILELGYTQFATVNRPDYAFPALNPVALADLFAPPPVFDAGFGNNGLGQRIGPVHALVLGAGLLLAPLRFRRQPAEALLAGGAGLLALLVVWLQTDGATPVWRALPVLDVVQFRWRLLSLLGLLAAIAIGCLLAQPPSFPAGRGSSGWRRGALGHPNATPIASGTPLLAGLLAAAFVLPQLPSLYPELLHRYARFDQPLTAAAAQARALAQGLPGLTTFGEFRPRWRTAPITAADQRLAAAGPAALLPSEVRVLSAERRNGWLQLVLDVPEALTAAFPVLYFPGWEGTVDGLPREVGPQPETGLLQLDLPPGAHTVVLRYAGTLVQRLGEGISLLAALLVLSAAVRWRRKAGGPLAERPAAALDARAPLALGAALLPLVALKALWLDPQTGLLRQHSTCAAVAGAQVRLDVVFGERVRLCGYSVSATTFRPGEPVELTLYWELLAPFDRPADSYVHLFGPALNPELGLPHWGQQDKRTPGGHLVTEWQVGKLYRDVYRFSVHPRAPAGPYQLEIGWWHPSDGRQLVARVLRADPSLAIADLGFLRIAGFRVARP